MRKMQLRIHEGLSRNESIFVFIGGFANFVFMRGFANFVFMRVFVAGDIGDQMKIISYS